MLSDAVVVVPGIMGSELRLAATGEVLWGANSPRAVVKLMAGRVDDLVVTDEDRAGRGRVEAARLICGPSFLEGLGFLDPYHALVQRLAELAPDQDGRAVLGFPYDWRLSIAHNSALLARACDEHLARWREVVRREHPTIDPGGVRLSLVCHSMGGLVARHALQTASGLADQTRILLTLGTPFLGSAKAIELLTQGTGTPIPMRAKAARRLAASCPGVHDLLPRYKCVRAPGAGAPRRLTASDLPGVCRDDFDDALARWRQLDTQATAPPSVKTLSLTGDAHPTKHLIEHNHGQLTFTTTRDGDGTVLVGSARPGFIHERHPVGETHGALQKSGHGLLWVADQLLDREPLEVAGAAARLGLDLADSFNPGPVECRVLGDDNHRATVSSEQLETGATTRWERVPAGKATLFRATLRRGFHRVTLSGDGTQSATKIIHVDTEDAE